MVESQVLEQSVEIQAIQRTPRTMEVFSGVSLLSRIVVVQKLIHNPGRFFLTPSSIAAVSRRCPVGIAHG